MVVRTTTEQLTCERNCGESSLRKCRHPNRSKLRTVEIPRQALHARREIDRRSAVELLWNYTFGKPGEYLRLDVVNSDQPTTPLSSLAARLDPNDIAALEGIRRKMLNQHETDPQ